MKVVPGAPMLALRPARRLEVPTGSWFSYERHALESWLRFEEARRRTRLETVLVPDYMCHEVVNSLRAAGRRVAYFPLGPGFAPAVSRVEELLAPRRGRAAVLMCHFYGRMTPGWSELARACARAEAPLAEDCAHLPFPFPTAAPFEADVRLYTFRKVYGVPYGATAILREGQSEFNASAAAALAARDEDGAALLSWAAREAAKRTAIALRLPVRRRYRDLSQDPLKPFSAAHPWAEVLLRAGAPEEAARARRRNAALYGANAGVFAGWAEPLSFGPEDVPYQLLLTLPSADAPHDFVSYMLERGVSALLGLALHEDVLASLPQDHHYRRQASLPLHQDVGPDDVERVVAAVRSYREARGV